MEKAEKRIIWIDSNINSIENQMFLEILKAGIPDGKFYPVQSIKEAFDLIRNKKEEITLLNGKKRESKVFQYRLFYTIVSGSLSNEFFIEYVKTTKELTIISANIIFCNEEEKHRYNAYYLDKFLNPGKVYNEKSIDKIIDYINKNERTFLEDSSLMESKKIYEPLKRSYGNVFFNASNISDIAYPFFFGQILNSTLISNYDLEGFQRFLLDYYPELKDFILPSREKNFDIPYYLLARFYLHMYTYEEIPFFKNMNLDLTNGKFDIYRIYIFLLYDALNKKSIKNFYTGNLYRGTVLSKKEYENLETLLQYQKDFKKFNKNKNGIDACLYNCKMFLSFSKSLNVAKGFMNKGNDDLIPVLFVLEGLKEKEVEKNDFFVSNLDLDNISEFNESEVLALPFSCFEIISIEDEEMKSFGDTIKYKKITLNYLSKYKTSLYKYIDGIKEKGKFEKFLKEVINSSFSYEIAELINFKDFDIGKEFQNFLKQKFILKKEFLDFKPIQCFHYKSTLYAQTAANKIFEEIPECVEKVLVDGVDAILVTMKNGTKMIMQTVENRVVCNVNCNGYERYNPPCELKVNNCSTNVLDHKLNKANNEFIEGKNDNWADKGMEKLAHKEKKLGLQKDGYFEFYSLGIAIGDLIANYDSVKDQPLMAKLKYLGGNVPNMLVPFLPRIFSTFLPKAVFSKVPYVMAAISAVEFIISTKDIISDKSISKSETFILIVKKAAQIGLQIAGTLLVGHIGFKILMFIPAFPGAVVVVPLLAVALGIGVGFAVRKIRNYINNNEARNELTFFSDSLYYQYIPTKFREYCIPTLYWKGVTENAKSFAIELVEDGYRKWLIINIKKWIRKISNDNHLDVGETIVNYKGISKNPFKVTFILYELKEDKFKPEDWGVGENVKKDYSERLSNSFIQVATLDVF